MIRKSITYTDYDGNERTETFYFNLNETEITELQYERQGGLKAWLEKITNSNDNVEIMKEFKKIILKAYGVKSDDGRRLIKNQQVIDEFTQTEAYNKLFMELVTGGDVAMANFIYGILPSNWSEQLRNNREKLIEEAKKLEASK